MKRVAVVLLGVVVLALMPTLGAAQGLFGSLPGLGSLGGYRSGAPACGGEKLCLKGPIVYLGYMEDRQGTSFSAETQNLPLLGADSLQHQFTNRGVWIGVSQDVPLSDRFGVSASGWYLIPSNNTSDLEQYNFGAGPRREWDTRPQWWYVDGLVSISMPCSGLTLLAGARYDEYTVRFENARNPIGVASTPNDTADVITYNVIPLFGTQYTSGSCGFGNLTVRAVGVPALIGSVKYNQTFGGAGTRIESRGNYKNGYFLEVFADYAKKFGPSEVGIFARWNMAHGGATLDVDALVPGGAVVGNRSFDLTLHRYSWTIGASFGLAFDMPFM